MVDNPTVESVFKDVMQHLAPVNSRPPMMPEGSSEDDVWTWEHAKELLVSMESDWSGIFADIAKNRDDRYIDIDIKNMKARGELLTDDSMIPRRVIDNNINREKSPKIQYLTSPRRQLIYQCVTDPAVKPDVIEKDYTRVSRYLKWTEEYFKCDDAASLSGWSSIQTLFDPEMPGHFRRKYIAPDRLMFPMRSTVNGFQDSNLVVAIIDITISKLKSWVQQFGFDQDQVNMVVSKDTTSGREKEDVIQIKQCFYRSSSGYVFMGWYHTSCTDWLRKPKPFWNGQVEIVQGQTPSGFGNLHMEMQGTIMPSNVDQPVFEKEYPFDIQIYRLDDNERVVEHRGRAFLDKYIQIGQTLIWSSFVNKLVRSSNVYGSPKGAGNETNPGAPKIEKAVKLINGAMYDKPMEFWEFPEPSVTAIAASNALASENASDTGSTAFQVINRKDARKTKKELSMAEEEEKTADSVDLTLYSNFVTSVEGRCWKIVQSRAASGRLPSFITVSPQAIAAGKGPEMEANRQYLLKQKYDVKSAGDSDYVERKEKINLMLQMMPMVGSTGISQEFLGELLVLMFPDDGTRWRDRLNETAAMPNVLKALVVTIQGLLEQHANQLKPNEVAGVDNVLQQALQVLGIPNKPQNPKLTQPK